MKLILSLFAALVITCAVSSCTRVVVCSCGVTVTTSTGADTTRNVSSQKYHDTLNNKGFCTTTFTDSLKMKYLTDRVDCSVNGVGM